MYINPHDLEIIYNGKIEAALKQGFEQGVEKGILQGSKQVAVRMLRDDVSLGVVAKYTGIPMHILKQLKIE